MIKATVITESDGIRTDSNIEGTGMNILSELAALNGTIIRQLLLNIDDVLEVLKGMTKAGLDILKEESENV